MADMRALVMSGAKEFALPTLIAVTTTAAKTLHKNNIADVQHEISAVLKLKKLSSYSLKVESHINLLKCSLMPTMSDYISSNASPNTQFLQI